MGKRREPDAQKTKERNGEQGELTGRIKKRGKEERKHTRIREWKE